MFIIRIIIQVYFQFNGCNLQLREKYIKNFDVSSEGPSPGNRPFPLQTNYKTRQGDANKSPQLSKIAKFGCKML